ncbi:MAG: hypothetical protein Kow00109_03550 [Acidobacteriota bacterium]
MSDYYRILGVSQDASREEIQRAFRRLAREHHPDAGGEASGEQFRRIREAYEVLSDPQRRAAYDAERGQGVRIRIQRSPQRPPQTSSSTVYEIRRAPGYRDIREVFDSRNSRSRTTPYDPFEELDRFILDWLRRWSW